MARSAESETCEAGAEALLVEDGLVNVRKEAQGAFDGTDPEPVRFVPKSSIGRPRKLLICGV